MIIEVVTYLGDHGRRAIDEVAFYNICCAEMSSHLDSDEPFLSALVEEKGPCIYCGTPVQWVHTDEGSKL